MRELSPQQYSTIRRVTCVAGVADDEPEGNANTLRLTGSKPAVVIGTGQLSAPFPGTTSIYVRVVIVSRGGPAIRRLCKTRAIHQESACQYKHLSLHGE